MKWIAIVLMGFLIGCSTNIPMSTTLDDEWVYDLEVNDSIPVIFQLENQLASGSFFQFEKKVGNILHPVDNEYVYNEYAVLDEMLKDLLRYRFTHATEKDPARINVSLKSVSISSEPTENEHVETLNSLFILPATRLYTAQVQVEVNVTYQGETHTRIIHGKANMLGAAFPKSKADVINFSKVLNQANNRVVHFTNQFLGDVGL